MLAELNLMSKWNDATVWRSLVDGSTCPICVRGFPLEAIATLASSWLTMPAHAPMPGYLCLVSRVHVVELHELDPLQAASFMDDMQNVSMALPQATGAIKLNYEIHGNTLPHLHVHFYPRYAGDPFENKAIELSDVIQPVYQPGQLQEIGNRVLGALRNTIRG